MVCCGLRNNVGLAETKQYHAISISTYASTILHCSIKQDLTDEHGGESINKAQGKNAACRPNVS
jgi:hypothetical protein